MFLRNNLIGCRLYFKKRRLLIQKKISPFYYVDMSTQKKNYSNYMKAIIFSLVFIPALT
jgi:hypothetical protein